ncbi:MAG: hypothetical protein ACFFDI_30560 [Promethearchaeota archaeon]
MKPLEAVRKYCLWCCCNQSKEVRLCPVNKCPLYPFRFGRNPDKQHKLNLKIIRRKCINCSGFSLSDVRECWDQNCALYPFRMGKNPNLIGKRGKKGIRSKKSPYHVAEIEQTF